jgi:alpha-L-fucosidase 2
VVAAMLVRSAHGRLDLLPALPGAWPRGRVTGLAARDAVRVLELSWAPGRVAAVLRARHETRIEVGAPAAGAAYRKVTLPAGRPVPIVLSP